MEINEQQATATGAEDGAKEKIQFYESNCVACEACANVCPTRAIVVKF